jgi:ribosomal protein S19E (S16A)
MPHKRSPTGKQKQKQRIDLYNQTREAKKIINESSYNDLEKHETVARTTTNEVLTEMGRRFTDGVIRGAVPDVEDGLVLSNDYGQGIFNV